MAKREFDLLWKLFAYSGGPYVLQDLNHETSVSADYQRSPKERSIAKSRNSTDRHSAGPEDWISA